MVCTPADTLWQNVNIDKRTLERYLVPCWCHQPQMRESVMSSWWQCHHLAPISQVMVQHKCWLKRAAHCYCYHALLMTGRQCDQQELSKCLEQCIPVRVNIFSSPTSAWSIKQMQRKWAVSMEKQNCHVSCLPIQNWNALLRCVIHFHTWCTLCKRWIDWQIKAVQAISV